MSHLLLQESHQSRWAGMISGDWDGCKEGWNQAQPASTESTLLSQLQFKSKGHTEGDGKQPFITPGEQPQSNRRFHRTQSMPRTSAGSAYRSVLGGKCCRLMLLEANDVARVAAHDTDLFPYQQHHLQRRGECVQAHWTLCWLPLC